MTSLDQGTPPPSIPLLESDPEFGATLEDRRARLRKMALISAYGSLFGIAVCCWLIVYPVPLFLSIAFGLLVPPATMLLYLWGMPAYSLALRPRNQRKTLLGICLPPIGGLCYLASHAALVDWTSTVVPVIVVGSVWAVLIILIFRLLRGQWVITVGLIVGCWVYAGAAILAANTVLDQGETTTYDATVTSKYTLSGYNGTTYWVFLSPWGPWKDTANSTKVNAELYGKVQARTVVCIVLHPGWSHFAWYKIGLCGQGAAS